MMTRDTLQWLHWLVASQTVNLASPDAREHAAKAWQALTELEAALTEGEPDAS